jgi:hypothetical protein
MARAHIVRLRRNKSFNRKPGRRKTEPLVLIACEGKTELEYFDAIRVARRLRTVEIPADAIGLDPRGLVEYAVRRAREEGGFDHVICAFDRDTHAHFAAARARIKTLAAGRNPIPIMEAVTIPAFEFWFLLHFERTASPYANCDDVIARLKTAGHIPNYAKADAALCRELAARSDLAIANARWLAEEAKKDGFVNPFTNVHTALELLNKLSADKDVG